MNLKNRSVARFRCHIDPMIPPKPRNSFDMRELSGWYMELTPAGVAVSCPIKDKFNKVVMEDHLIPFANIQSIKLAQEEKSEDKEVA